MILGGGGDTAGDTGVAWENWELIARIWNSHQTLDVYEFAVGPSTPYPMFWGRFWESWVSWVKSGIDMSTLKQTCIWSRGKKQMGKLLVDFE